MRIKRRTRSCLIVPSYVRLLSSDERHNYFDQMSIHKYPNYVNTLSKYVYIPIAWQRYSYCPSKRLHWQILKIGLLSYLTRKSWWTLWQGMRQSSRAWKWISFYIWKQSYYSDLSWTLGLSNDPNWHWKTVLLLYFWMSKSLHSGHSDKYEAIYCAEPGSINPQECKYGIPMNCN